MYLLPTGTGLQAQGFYVAAVAELDSLTKRFAHLSRNITAIGSNSAKCSLQFRLQ